MGGQTPPLIVDGNIYVDTQNLLSIKASTGSVNWQASNGDSAGLAYANGELFSVSRGGRFLRMRFERMTRCGRLSSQVRPSSTRRQPLGGMVYASAAGVGGNLYGVDASNGRLVWTGDVENGVRVIRRSHPTEYSSAYACQQTYDFDPKTGDPLWRLRRMRWWRRNDTGVDGAYLLVQDSVLGDVVLNASDGSVVRSFPPKPTPATNGSEMFVVEQRTFSRQRASPADLSSGASKATADLATNPIVVNRHGLRGVGLRESICQCPSRLGLKNGARISGQPSRRTSSKVTTIWLCSPRTG